MGYYGAIRNAVRDSLADSLRCPGRGSMRMLSA